MFWCTAAPTALMAIRDASQLRLFALSDALTNTELPVQLGLAALARLAQVCSVLRGTLTANVPWLAVARKMCLDMSIDSRATLKTEMSRTLFFADTSLNAEISRSLRSVTLSTAASSDSVVSMAATIRVCATGSVEWTVHVDSLRQLQDLWLSIGLTMGTREPADPLFDASKFPIAGYENVSLSSHGWLFGHTPGSQVDLRSPYGAGDSVRVRVDFDAGGRGSLFFKVNDFPEQLAVKRLFGSRRNGLRPTHVYPVVYLFDQSPIKGQQSEREQVLVTLGSIIRRQA